MTAKEIRDLSDDELERALAEAREAYFNLRFQHASARSSACRSSRPAARIARLLTVARERSWRRERGPADAQESVSRRKSRQGIVVSAARDKTITVLLETARPHPVYGKTVRRSSKLHAHDERNDASEGDMVRIVECRPCRARSAGAWPRSSRRRADGDGPGRARLRVADNTAPARSSASASWAARSGATRRWAT